MQNYPTDQVRFKTMNNKELPTYKFATAEYNIKEMAQVVEFYESGESIQTINLTAYKKKGKIFIEHFKAFCPLETTKKDLKKHIDKMRKLVDEVGYYEEDFDYDHYF